MTIETNRDQADVLLRLALEDNRDGHWQSAYEHWLDAGAFLGEIRESMELACSAQLDQSIRDMDTIDLEELLQSGGMK